MSGGGFRQSLGCYSEVLEGKMALRGLLLNLSQESGRGVIGYIA